MNFTLAPQLAKDCHIMGKSGDIHILLNRNALFPWFILVPECNVTEFYLLSTNQQSELISLINSLSVFINSHFTVDKLNIATIGNVVSQMHVHVVGRTHTDPCWPGVVWGTTHFAPYRNEDVDRIRQELIDQHICSL